MCAQGPRVRPICSSKRVEVCFFSTLRRRSWPREAPVRRTEDVRRATERLDDEGRPCSAGKLSEGNQGDSLREMHPTSLSGYAGTCLSEGNSLREGEQPSLVAYRDNRENSNARIRRSPTLLLQQSSVFDAARSHSCDMQTQVTFTARPQLQYARPLLTMPRDVLYLLTRRLAQDHIRSMLRSRCNRKCFLRDSYGYAEGNLRKKSVLSKVLRPCILHHLLLRRFEYVEAFVAQYPLEC